MGESRKFIGEEIEREESHVFSKIQKHQMRLKYIQEYLNALIQRQSKLSDIISIEAKSLT